MLLAGAYCAHLHAYHMPHCSALRALEQAVLLMAEVMQNPLHTINASSQRPNEMKPAYLVNGLEFWLARAAA